jgi:hypothetical protein
MLRRRASNILVLLSGVALIAAVAGLAVLYRPLPPVAPRAVRLPTPSLQGGRWTVQFPAEALTAEVASFRDELTAVLHFEYLASRPAIAHTPVLLSARETPAGPAYHLSILVDRNILTAVPYLADLEADGYITGFQLDPLSKTQLDERWRQTRAFDAAFDGPARRRLTSLSDEQLLPGMARFIVFKSETDRRVRKQIEPLPTPVSTKKAYRLAADMLFVARFYRLPLASFMGIAAMENNYMNVSGDLEHAVWKRGAQKGDIILKRRGRRVLVLNYATGVWQITRETLRYAHRLYLKDKETRDYYQLPYYLRPPEELDFGLSKPRALTTYAGLILRDLLDRFDGNVEKAVAAYNGGVGHPNYGYAEGVELVARYARSFLEHAAALNGRNLGETLLASRHPSRIARPGPQPVELGLLEAPAMQLVR